MDPVSIAAGKDSDLALLVGLMLQPKTQRRLRKKTGRIYGNKVTAMFITRLKPKGSASTCYRKTVRNRIRISVCGYGFVQLFDSGL